MTKGDRRVMLEAARSETSPSRIRGIGRAVLCAAILSGGASAFAQEPAGLARSALDDPAFSWIREGTEWLRVYFLEGSYPAAHRDSLVELARRARDHALATLGAERFDRSIDVFFIESRAQMDSLVGAPVTGFAHRDARAVFLVTNAEWRSFERHEIMHVIAHHVWDPPAEPSAWIVEGLAQFADGRCGGYSVDSVTRSLVDSNGTVPLDKLTRRFRQLNDLTAYLQAASIVGYIYRVHGRDAVERTWREGLDGLSASIGLTPRQLMDGWTRWLERIATPIPEDALASISRKGCG